ncbi:hypothetical protein LINPERPRIM_LOCUS33141, partial [Linum perenne]
MMILRFSDLYRMIVSVLVAILKLYEMMLAKPSPVSDNCTDHRWKYFKGGKDLLMTVESSEMHCFGIPRGTPPA